MVRNFVAFLVSLFASSLAFTFNTHANFNYAEALQKAIYFYDIQRSGKIDINNRVTWRANSDLKAGEDQSIDLSGGFYDAGDNMKFSFPLAYTTTILAWAILDFSNGFIKTKELEHVASHLKWSTDYLIKTIVLKENKVERIYGQVGNPDIDRALFYLPHEALMQAHLDHQIERPSYFIDAAHPGTDLAAAVSAALSASSLVFQQFKDRAEIKAVVENPLQYAQTLLTYSQSTYEFANQTPKQLYSTQIGRYKNNQWELASVLDYYPSTDYRDDLAFAGAWLYRATADSDYLNQATALMEQIGFVHQDTMTWDDKTYGAYVLLAHLIKDETVKEKYKQAAQQFLNAWVDPCLNGQVINNHSCLHGLAWDANHDFSHWGSLSIAANTAFLALHYAQQILTTNPTLATRYQTFAHNQIDYLLGKNNYGLSFEIGFGQNYPMHYYHATAQGAWNGLNTGPGSIADTNPNRHVAYGALVGGPTHTFALGWNDDRTDFIGNETGLDYNAGFVAALAGLNHLLMDNGTPLPNNQFPVKETPKDEFYVGAYYDALEQSATKSSIHLSTQLYNHSAWPAEVIHHQSYLVFLTLNAEEIKHRAMIMLTVDHSQGLTADPVLYHDSGNYFYFIIKSELPMYPGGNEVLSTTKVAPAKREIRYTITMPWYHDFKNDWSFRTIASNVDDFPPISTIPVVGEKESGDCLRLLGGIMPSTKALHECLNIPS